MYLGEPYEHAGLGEVFVVGVFVDVLDQPEVEHLDEVRFVPLRHEHHVARLHVAVDHAQTDAPRATTDTSGLAMWIVRAASNGPSARSTSLRVRPSMSFHHDEERVVGLTVVEHGHGVRVRELRDGGRLEKEAFAKLRVFALLVARAEHLDGDHPTERGLLRLVDRAHPPARDPAEDAETIDDHRPDQRVGGPRTGDSAHRAFSHGLTTHQCSCFLVRINFWLWLRMNATRSPAGSAVDR